MPDTFAPPGVSLITSLRTLYTHPADATTNAVVRVRLSNIDDVNDANVTACNFVDASAASAKNPILPVNVKVAKLDALEFDKILEPGDRIEASASAAGDIFAAIDVYQEPV